MALSAANYLDLFENIGEFIERVNEFTAYYAPLEAGRDEIEEQLKTNDQILAYEGVDGMFEEYKGSVASWISMMIGKVNELLTDEDRVQDNLSLEGDASFENIFLELYKDMVTAVGTDALSSASSASGNAFTITVPSSGGGLGTAVTVTLKNAAGMLLVPGAYEIFVNSAGADALTGDGIIKGINGGTPDADAVSGNPDVKYGSSVLRGVPGITASDGSTSTDVTLSADSVSGNW